MSAGMVTPFTGDEPITACPIDLENDSQAIRDFKAAHGAMRYGLQHGGWTAEQITTGLAAYIRSIRAAVAEELTDHLWYGQEEVAIRMTPGYAAGWRHGMATAARKVAGE